MITCRPPEPKDIVALAFSIRAGDRREVEALQPDMSLITAIDESVKISKGALAVHDNGMLLCIFGISSNSTHPELGIPWMLSTYMIHTYSTQVKIHRWGKLFIEAMMEEYTMIGNLVHTENRDTIKWLSSMGFEVVNESHMVSEGEFFLPFRKRAESIIGDFHV